MFKGLRVLLVDDDDSLLQLLRIRLTKIGVYVETTDSPSSVISLLMKQQFDCVISDLRMPDMDGMDLFHLIQADFPSLPVIIMTAHGSIDEAIHATREGALGFLEKPIVHEKLEALLEKIKSEMPLVNEQWPRSIIANSDTMWRVLEKAKRIASRDVNVLITGASGTGKELLARELHNASYREQHPFVAINCSAIPENLLESELFGYQKGAFTGANHDHPGLFQQANGGTLFLDEIGDMSFPLQAKLLRALQEQIVRPLGSVKDVQINVRVLSATHKDLNKAMLDGEFREDLYYRLNVVNLALPDLKERAEDIPILVKYFIEESCKRYGVDQRTSITEDALAELINHPWPGNIRQLQNVIEQCVALCEGPNITKVLILQALQTDKSSWPSLTEAKDTFEFQYLNKLLRLTMGNVTKAADLAGRNRSDLHKLLKKHSLDAASFRHVSH